MGVEDAATLLEAAGKGDISTIEECISKKVDVNTRDKQGFTPLLFAVRHNREDAFVRLLGLGADVNIPSTDGFTGLTLAARHGHGNMIDTLVKSKCDLESTTLSGGTGLMWASHNGYTDVVAKLLDAGALVRLAHMKPPVASTLRPRWIMSIASG